MVRSVTVVGAGLAGTECAIQLARRGVNVVLREMKPVKRSPAHKSDSLAELVCSNSLRSDNPANAIGLLHEELRRLDSLVLSAADHNRVPAGDALAVERDGFSRSISARIREQGNVTLIAAEVTKLVGGLVIVATGPLTSAELTEDLFHYIGAKLYFYDAIAPIVSADTIDSSNAFRMSRYGKGGGDDYLNLPLSKEQYLDLVAELRAGKRLDPHEFEEPKYFEGCLPIEVMAERGDDVLRHGPMKPVGLLNPHTGQRPYAVVQLRMEDTAGSAFNLVGFQTRLTWGEQKRILSKIPGLENAEYLRMGQIHRNTFIDSPRLLNTDLSLKSEPRIFFAGQITGVEGYVESAACGYLAALAVQARLAGIPFLPPPATTALGALYRHVTGEAHPADYVYQPSNVTFALFPPLTGKVRKADKKMMYLRRAREDFGPWCQRALGNLVRISSPVSTAPVEAHCAVT